MDISISINELDMSNYEVAELLRGRTEMAKGVVSSIIKDHSSCRVWRGGVYEDRDVLADWRCAFNQVHVPELSQVAGKDWPAVLEILERGNIDEIRRWLTPIAEACAPKPRLKTAETAA